METFPSFTLQMVGTLLAFPTEPQEVFRLPALNPELGSLEPNSLLPFSSFLQQDNRDPD